MKTNAATAAKLTKTRRKLARVKAQRKMLRARAAELTALCHRYQAAADHVETERSRLADRVRELEQENESLGAQLLREQRGWEAQRLEGQTVNGRLMRARDAAQLDFRNALAQRDAVVAKLRSMGVMEEIIEAVGSIGYSDVEDITATEVLSDDIDPRPDLYDAAASDRLRWHARQALAKTMLELLDAAWGIIANTGPIEVDPPSASPGWSQAALRFRERYFDLRGRLHPPRPSNYDHHTHIHVSMALGKPEGEVTPAQVAADAAAVLAVELEKRARERAGGPPPFRGGGILPTDLLGGRPVPSHDPTTAAGTSMLEPERSEAELEDELLAAVADATPEELEALAAMADELAPLRAYEPMSEPAGIVTQDTETGQVVDSPAAHTEARIARGVSTGEPPATTGYVPASPEAQAAMAHDGTTDEAAMEAGRVLTSAEVNTVGTYTVTDLDGSTATYAHDAVMGRDEPLSTTPPLIELPRVRYDDLLAYLSEELDAEEPEADAADILAALGLYVEGSPPETPEPTELDHFRMAVAGSWDELVTDVLAHRHMTGGPRNPGPWFLEAATVLLPGLAVLRSGDRDHIWELARQVALEKAQADLEGARHILAQEEATLRKVSDRVETFAGSVARHTLQVEALGGQP